MSILQEVRDHRVLECKFFHALSGSAGFAVMTNCYQFFVVADSSRSRDEIRVKKLPDLPCKRTYIHVCICICTVHKYLCDLLWKLINVHISYIQYVCCLIFPHVSYTRIIFTSILN